MTYEQLQIVSGSVIVLAGIIFIFLEKKYPYNLNQRTFRDGFWIDLIGYGVIQSYVMGLVIAAFIYYLDHQTGFSRLRVVSDFPIWAQVALFVVWHDFNTYFIHRSQHKFPWLWRTHEAHHSCPQVDWLSGIRSHSLEIILYEVIKFIPIILLGAAPEVPLWRAMIDSTYGMFIHSNLNWRLGPLLYLFNGPELHRWHHSRNQPEAVDKNFSTKLAIWDFLFKTTYHPAHKIASEYGPDDPHFPKGYFAQLFYCFRPRTSQ